jgi:predicted nucleotidyltransferase
MNEMAQIDKILIVSPVNIWYTFNMDNHFEIAIPIDISAQALAVLCHQYHIQELALFGSILRDDFRADSDVDILVEFEAESQVGYLQFFRLQNELSKLFGREVDLFTPNSLKPFARETTLQSKTVIYAS